MCRGPAAIAQPPSQATHPSNQGRFTFTFEQFLYKRRNNCVNSGLRPGGRLDRDPAALAAASTATLQPWPPPRPRPCSHGSSVSSFVISSTCCSFYTNVLCRSSSCPRLLPGPPPASPASSRRGRGHRGLPWSGRSLARLCLVYTSSPGAVRSVLLFNL